VQSESRGHYKNEAPSARVCKSPLGKRSKFFVARCFSVHERADTIIQGGHDHSRRSVPAACQLDAETRANFQKVGISDKWTARAGVTPGPYRSAWECGPRAALMSLYIFESGFGDHFYMATLQVISAEWNIRKPMASMGFYIKTPLCSTAN
jgi:hypothetical protein